MTCGVVNQDKGKGHMCILEDTPHEDHICACGYSWTGGQKDLPHITQLSLSDDELYFLASFIIYSHSVLNRRGLGIQLKARLYMITVCNQVGSTVVESFMERFKKLAEANPNFTSEPL